MIYWWESSNIGQSGRQLNIHCLLVTGIKSNTERSLYGFSCGDGSHNTRDKFRNFVEQTSLSGVLGVNIDLLTDGHHD
jgi:hypothetical protein